MFTNPTEAATDGKLNSHSSGSIDISITVNQTLQTISPSEFIVEDKSFTNKQNSIKPFCVAHHGFGHETSVPYQLIVDEIKLANKDQNNHFLPFDIILEDKYYQRSKQRLVRGMTIAKQSKLKISDDLSEECATNGLSLSIEKNAKSNKTLSQASATALLFLLVSPE